MLFTAMLHSHHSRPDEIIITTGSNPGDHEAVLRALRQFGIRPSRISDPLNAGRPLIVLSFDLRRVSRRQAAQVVEAALREGGVRSVKVDEILARKRKQRSARSSS